MLSQITPLRDKKNNVDGLALAFSLKPINVNLTSGFSKINVFNSVTA
jgi:hypothetical protein